MRFTSDIYLSALSVCFEHGFLFLDKYIHWMACAECKCHRGIALVGKPEATVAFPSSCPFFFPFPYCFNFFFSNVVEDLRFFHRFALRLWQCVICDQASEAEMLHLVIFFSSAV